ncbi:hypothetical protein LB552_08925 [Mesorhizobium sp. CA7]|nr:hypothetical protein [Mesorhizobium sp. CA7]
MVTMMGEQGALGNRANGWPDAEEVKRGSPPTIMVTVGTIVGSTTVEIASGTYRRSLCQEPYYEA